MCLESWLGPSVVVRDPEMRHDQCSAQELEATAYFPPLRVHPTLQLDLQFINDLVELQLERHRMMHHAECQAHVLEDHLEAAADDHLGLPSQAH